MTDTPIPSLLPVALDAMGGDRAPGIPVEGAVLACREGFGPIVLVGDQALIEPELERHDLAGLAIEVVHAPDMIAMGENPARAARTKRGSSMHRCFDLLRNGEGCATVSAGNSGAFLGVGLLTVRRSERCDRPCIATSLPTRPAPTVLLDIGANVEARATHLVQFALMGAAYSSVKHGIERPSVALLSNGTETIKGTEALREAHRLLTQTHLNYIGFVEGRDLPNGCADVVVTDGLVGNIVLKLCEGMVTSLFQRIRTAIEEHWIGSLVAPFFKKTLRGLHAELDWQNVGGAPLLGLNGVALVGHGQTTPRAIANSISKARAYSSSGLLEAVNAALLESNPAEWINTSELPMSQTGETERED